MRFMPALKRASLVLAACAALAAPTRAFETPQVTASAEEASVIVTEGRAQATFKIRVTNNEASALGNVFVEYADGNGVTLGDIAAGASKASDPETRTFAVEIPSKNHSLPVTLKFVLNGDAREVPATLALRVE